MSQVEDAIAYARAQIGKPYVFGTKGPNTFDCSGLIVASYAAANPPITLPHWTGALIGMGSEVSRANLQPGDLVFPDSGHVQLYVGNNMMIEAQQRNVPVREGALWGFWRARRIVGANTGAAASSSSVVGAIQDVLLPDWAHGLGAPIANVTKITGNLVDPNFYKRIGGFIAGASIIAIGLAWALRRPAATFVSKTGTVIGEVGSSIVSGAAFGAGTNVGPGKSASQAIAKKGTPKAPASAIPRTAPISPRSPYQVSPGSVYVGASARKAQKLPNPGRTSGDTVIATGIFKGKKMPQ